MQRESEYLVKWRTLKRIWYTTVLISLACLVVRSTSLKTVERDLTKGDCSTQIMISLMLLYSVCVCVCVHACVPGGGGGVGGVY